MRELAGLGTKGNRLLLWKLALTVLDKGPEPGAVAMSQKVWGLGRGTWYVPGFCLKSSNLHPAVMVKVLGVTWNFFSSEGFTSFHHFRGPQDSCLVREELASPRRHTPPPPFSRGMKEIPNGLQRLCSP